MKYWIRIVFAFVCACMIFPLNAFCGTEFPDEIRAVGRAVIFDGNEAKAREDAMAEAVSNAFAQYLSEGMGTEAMHSNFPLIEGDVLPRAEELAENFLILSESRGEGSLSVLLKVKFNRKLVEDLLSDSGIRFEAGRQGRILVMTAEESGGQYSFWWLDPGGRSTLGPVELAVRNAFESRGFVHVDHGSVTAENITPSMKSRELDNGRLAEWGRLYGADFILYGSSHLDEKGELELWLKAVKTGDATSLAETRQTGIVNGGISDVGSLLSALDTAAAGAAETLVPAMFGMEASEPGRSQVISVVLEWAGALVDSPLLERHMEEHFPGVAGLRTARLGGSRVIFEVTYRGDPRLFAERLVGEGSPFQMKSTLDGSGTIWLERSGFIEQLDSLLRSKEGIPHSVLDNPS
jgi:hypothetical protein